MLIAAGVSSNVLVSVLVAAILFGLGRVIIQRVAYAEANPWLVRILTISLVLHLLAAPAQIFVVDHFYHGIADWTRYVGQGATLSSNFRGFNFTTAGSNVGKIVNDGSVSIAAGIVMAIVGVNKLATFLVFSWLSFMGCVLFLRAFTLTFPKADHRRYVYMLFFLPSIIFWTADVSKESLMIMAGGLLAYGAAKFLARKRGGFVLIAPGVFIGAYVRPNELLLFMAGFVVAMMVPTAATRKSFGGIRRLVGLAFLGSLLFLSVSLTYKYLSGPGGSISLNQINSNNQNAAGTLGFGSSKVPYSTNLATYPRDLYEVMFNPLPYNAHGFGQMVAALENLVILSLILTSLRNLRMLPRAAFARPYVMLCAVYFGGFVYTFAALGNLGLIQRERVVILPFLLVLLCIPRAPRGARPRYEWELRRGTRLRRRRMLEQRAARRPPQVARR